MSRVTSLVAAALLTAVAASAQQPGPPPRVVPRGGVEQPAPTPRVIQRGGVEPPVQLRFQDGLVTLRAQNAPIRTILVEWARLGGTTIVNGDYLPGPPLTLELTGVPERQALDVVLRTAAGYMLAPRRAGATGVSAFDRIVILPTSVAPPPAAAAARPAPAAIRSPVIARARAPVPVPDATLVDAPEVELPDDGIPPSDQAATPGPPQPRVLPGRLVRPPVVVPGGAPELVPEQEEPEVAEADSEPATASNPFGIPAGSSTRPGVIAPAPKPQPANRVQ
jgi:hypothetical protein